MTLSLATLTLAPAGAASLPVVMKGGTAYVAAAGLEREAGIVIKRLPGRGGYVACGAQQCAPLKAVVTDGDALLVPVDGVGEALNLNANFDENRRNVAFVPARGELASAGGSARVGSIAPNLRLTRLDGTPLSLDEFRGQRVLINSWASW